MLRFAFSWRCKRCWARFTQAAFLTLVWQVSPRSISSLLLPSSLLLSEKTVVHLYQLFNPISLKKKKRISMVWGRAPLALLCPLREVGEGDGGWRDVEVSRGSCGSSKKSNCSFNEAGEKALLWANSSSSRERFSFYRFWVCSSAAFNVSWRSNEEDFCIRWWEADLRRCISSINGW